MILTIHQRTVFGGDTADSASIDVGLLDQPKVDVFAGEHSAEGVRGSPILVYVPPKRVQNPK